MKSQKFAIDLSGPNEGPFVAGRDGGSLAGCCCGFTPVGPFSNIDILTSKINNAQEDENLSYLIML
ncbi:MAG TPA: hypothetical protein PKD37_00725 [Oligoflexia bacterium]|nr:hypothetical protein [Oligoflexia bacterium]HMP26505.1 hypothetical protein [Oligoflexia bacterium]